MCEGGKHWPACHIISALSYKISACKKFKGKNKLILFFYLHR